MASTCHDPVAVAPHASGPTISWLTKATAMPSAGPCCGSAASRTPSQSARINWSGDATGQAGPCGSMRCDTAGATWWSGASTSSSNGAAWRPATTSVPSTIAPRSPSPLSCSGSPIHQTRPSALSGGMFGNSEMSMVGTVEGGADALDEFGGWQQTSRFDDAALAMDPLGFDGIQPRRLDRQIARHDPHPGAGQFDLAVVATDPGPDLMTDMPGGVVPDQQQRCLPERLQLGAAPRQVLRSEPTDRAAIHKAEPGFLVPAAGGLSPADQQAVARQGFWNR